MAQTPDLVTTRQACDALGWHRSTLMARINFPRAGKLPGHNGDVLYARADINTLAQAHNVTPQWETT